LLGRIREEENILFPFRDASRADLDRIADLQSADGEAGDVPRIHIADDGERSCWRCRRPAALARAPHVNEECHGLALGGGPVLDRIDVRGQFDLGIEFLRAGHAALGARPAKLGAGKALLLRQGAPGSARRPDEPRTDGENSRPFGHPYRVAIPRIVPAA
jgi:hypothetical protein